MIFSAVIDKEQKKKSTISSNNSSKKNGITIGMKYRNRKIKVRRLDNKVKLPRLKALYSLFVSKMKKNAETLHTVS